ncbi:IS1182 family transposase [Lentilactobacillus parafarraginis]|uniref:IS1182 family transposase n=3 Tax=Lentilactobacillus parafarraginis TaxID=390842 RepID=A0A5R9CFV8_9LACO|nr:IS1182 family transposase [Lentilactobacillus parafarraginis]TLQ14166.1 IS1182 family transposase [Lentilactobacillus parafarraginis]
MGKHDHSKRKQIQFVTIDEMVPKDHLLRKIDKVIDFDFIYELVQPLYTLDNGRPGLDPVILIKLPIIQYLFGIRSMRQTIKEIQVNMAYRWFLGLDMVEVVPHFTTFGKNFERRFKGTDLFEQIFKQILLQCVQAKLVDPSVLFVDGTHVKADANNHKFSDMMVNKEAVNYRRALDQEIEKDRVAHGKGPLKADQSAVKTKRQKVSRNDPESGWFHKGEHKQVFAYNVQTACDAHGWVIDYTIHPGNQHDSQAFDALYQKLKSKSPRIVVADAGYKTPAIAHELISDHVTPIFPYKRPMTKPGFFRKREYVYDEYYDCYLCPNNKVLKYSTTNRDGYREYKSNPQDCKTCPLINQCTLSKNHQKVVTRHVWEDDLETCEEIRHTYGLREWYDVRKETIERVFGTAKEFHGLRYTNMRGKDKMAMKVGLTFACLNMKKLAKICG